MAQSNTNRSVFSPDIDGLELLLGRRPPSAGHEASLPAKAAAPGDDQLLGYIKRSLAGEPFPVSAPRLRTAAEEAVPLALRIREILRSEQANDSVAAEPAPENDLPAPSAIAPAPTEPVPHRAEPRIALSLLDVDLPPLAAAPRLSRPAIGWGSAAFVLLITVGGACLPGVFAAPPRFASEARLQLLGLARTMPGFLEATTLRLTSPRLLSQVVTKLKLDHDAEFSGGKATSYSVVMDLLTDSGAAADSFSRAQVALQQALTVVPDRQAGMVSVTVQSADPKKSARIANLLADIAVRDAAAKPFASPPSQAELDLENSRKRYDDANAALAAFKATAGDDKIAAATDLMERKGVLNNQIATAASAAQTAAIRLSAARAVKMADVLDGSISPDLGSPAPLEDLRNRYAAARSTLGQLSTQLGPRHPRLLAVQATIDTLSAAILAEIQKMVIASDAEAKTAGTQLKQLKQRLVDLNGQTVDVDLSAFGQLQNNVETARQAYEAGLTAAEEVKPSAANVDVPLALSAPAVPASLAMGSDLIGRSLIGALAGLAMALAMVGCRWLAGSRSRGKSFGDDAIDFDMVDLLAQVPAVTDQARTPLDPPQKRFDATAPVANDRSTDATNADATEHDPALTAIIGDVASLRAKVATYVSQRNAAAR